MVTKVSKYKATVYSANSVKHMIRLYVQVHGFQEVADATQTRWTDLHKVIDGDWFPGPKLLNFFGLKKVSEKHYAPDVEGIL